MDKNFANWIIQPDLQPEVKEQNEKEQIETPTETDILRVFSAYRFKHLAGQHNQRRHGWRYGGGTTGSEEARLGAARSSMRGMSKPEREEYRKRAGLPMEVPKKAFVPTVSKPEHPYDPAKGMGTMSVGMNREGKEALGVSGTYSPGFVTDAHRLGGKWDSYTKTWEFSRDKLDAVRPIFYKHYNRENDPDIRAAHKAAEAKKAEQHRKEVAQRQQEYEAKAAKEPATSKQISYIGLLASRYQKASGGQASIRDFGKISKLRASELIDMLKDPEMASSMGLFPGGGGIGIREPYGGEE